LNATGPFTSDLTKGKVSLDPNFFQLDTIYNFILNIISSQAGVDVIVKQNWNVTTNSQPKSNYLDLKFYSILINFHK